MYPAEATGLLVLQRLDPEECGRRLGVTGRRIEHCQRWRKAHNIENAHYRSQIAANMAARATGSRSSWQAPVGAVSEALVPFTATTDAPPRPARANAYNPTAAEIMAFVKDVGDACVRLELERQLGRPVSYEEVAKLADWQHVELLKAASIREAEARIHGGGRPR